MVLGPCASVGRKATAPEGLTVKPTGPETSAKVRRCTGKSTSLAERAKARLPVSATCWAGTPAITGGVFGARTTTTRKEFVTCTTPSLTDTSTRFVVAVCAVDGVQDTVPFSATVRPVGPCTLANTRRCTGTSVSSADNRMVHGFSGSIAASATATIVGATFTSRTTTENSRSTVSVPSLTDTRTEFVEGPWVSEGSHRNWPSRETVRPTGPLRRAKASGWVGRSASVAASWRSSDCPSSTEKAASPVHTGA